MEAAAVAFRLRALAHWSFDHYLDIAPPGLAHEVLAGVPPAAARPVAVAA
jgi:hypothetical protein